MAVVDQDFVTSILTAYPLEVQSQFMTLDATAGTVAAGKAVVADSTLVTDVAKIQGITNGTVAASKAVVADASRAIDQLTIKKLILQRTTLAAHTSLQSTCTASLSFGLNVISATTTDSGGAKLPTCEAGAIVAVKNDAASTVWVFTDGVVNCSVNALASSTGFPVATTKTTILIGDTASRWITFPLAVA